MTKDLLETLINLTGVSGNEHDVRNFIIREAKKYMKNVKVDTMGNIIAIKKGKRPAILFLAHMDEIGLMVRGITHKGKMWISALGGIDPRILLGQRVEVETKDKKKINGLITTNDVLNDFVLEKQIKIEDLYVYTGLDKKALEQKGVEVGSYVSFSSSCDFCTLGGTKEMIAGKALDDRIGCYVLLELMKELKTKNGVIFVFTVQEEIGLYGAKASVFTLEPDYAIAVDVTGHDDEGETMMLGKGPALTIKDAEMLANQCLVQEIERVAKKLKISLQREVSDHGTTDATSIFAAKGGIPSGVIGISVANLHTTMGMACRTDLEQLIKILKGFLKEPPTKCWR